MRHKISSWVRSRPILKIITDHFFEKMITDKIYKGGVFCRPSLAVYAGTAMFPGEV